MTALGRTAPALLAAAACALLAATFPVGCVRPEAGPSATPQPVSSGVVVPSASSSALPSAPRPDATPVAPVAPKPHRFAVAAESATAARIAMDVLEHGGSAVDAAIAGVLTSGVTHPVSSGIGGGGFAVVWDAKARQIKVLDFRETAPLGLRASELWKHVEKRRGVWAGVPGEIAGLFELHARWGKRAMADDVRAAASVAEQGFPLSAHMARALKWNEAWVQRSDRYAMFAPGGVLLPVRETVKNPALAATLARVAAEGRAAFYEGTIAEDVVDTARAAGGRMTMRELRDYRVIERSPMHASWEGFDVYTMPPESAGGLMVLETLRMHPKAELVELGAGSGGYLHLLAETFRGAVADRVRSVGDPAYVKEDVEALAAPARMKTRRAAMSLTSTTPAERFSLDESGTTHFVAVDGEGNVVSLTSTVNNMFGSRLVTRGGFVLNDELDDFTPMTTERRFGMRAGRGPNSPRGGARPASSMTPTIVLQGGEPVLAVGGSGGMKIATATTQVLLARLAFGRSIADAIGEPRIDTPPMGGLTIDPGVPAALVADLAGRGEVVDATKPNFSAVQAVAIGVKDGVRFLEAGADPRKGGAALVQ
jgi:gamma-glutamyltranspeptidase/glutathione hydrolase